MCYWEKGELRAQASEVSEQIELKLSPSVTSAAGHFSDGEEVSALALTKAVLELHHSDYAGGKATAFW